MPMNNLSVGNDVRVDIVGPYGYVTLTTLTSFSARQMTNSLESMPLGQTPIFAEVPKGWEGDFTVQRNDSTLDDFFALIESNYWSGKNVPSGLITETITDPSGAVHQYQYTGAVFKFDGIGERKQDAFIDGKVGFKASQRRKIS